MKIALLEGILTGLMSRYQERVPDVPKITAAMKAEGLISQDADIENDHIAFRTIGVPHLGIASLEKIFLHCGYTKRDPYHFKEKKVDAYWYAPPEERFPRIFMSELLVGELSKETQEIICSYTEQVGGDPVDDLDLEDIDAVDSFLHTSQWTIPTWEDYEALLAESDYAAWAIYNRYFLNHYTISVHSLPHGNNTLPQFNDFLQKHGILLNTSGGKIKTSEDGLLLQSSTVAEMIDADFPHKDGAVQTHRIAGSFIEFAERKVLPEFAHLPEEQVTRVHRREGFEAGNADKIFESTYLEQIERDTSGS